MNFRMTHLQKIFINNLRFYRTERGFTQLNFSEAVGVTPNYLNAVENGRNFPSADLLQRMIDKLRILPYRLFLEKPALRIGADSIQTITALRRGIDDLFEKGINEQERAQEDKNE